jgi:hypothetical protein
MNTDFPNFNLNLDLSLEQEFKIKLFEQSVQGMNSEDMRSLFLSASKLLTIKDNIIQGLIKQHPSI